MRFTLAALLLLSTATLAHADTFQTFTLNGSLYDGSFTGTVTLNQTTGLFTSESSLFVTTETGGVAFEEAMTTTGFLDNFSYAQFQNGLYTAYIEIATPSLIGYNGGQICSTTATCPDGHFSMLLLQTINGAVTSGSLTPVVPTTPGAGSPAVTPEPSSFVLLGTGLLSFAGAARRRFLKA